MPPRPRAIKQFKNPAGAEQLLSSRRGFSSAPSLTLNSLHNRLSKSPGESLSCPKHLQQNAESRFWKESSQQLTWCLKRSRRITPRHHQTTPQGRTAPSDTERRHSRGSINQSNTNLQQLKSPQHHHPYLRTQRKSAKPISATVCCHHKNSSSVNTKRNRVQTRTLGSNEFGGVPGNITVL